ncbi:MAG: hypothetical protein ACTSW1_06705 [Candidatus Hodarchaeales archaeon]
MIRSIVLEHGGIVDSGLEIGGLVQSLKQEHEVALDITSGRKAVVAGALLSTTDCKPDHIYYLEIDTLDDVAKPYSLISRHHHRLHDFRAETRRAA